MSDRKKKEKTSPLSSERKEIKIPTRADLQILKKRAKRNWEIIKQKDLQ